MARGEGIAPKGSRDALVLAEHFERGGDPARAVPWWLRAAEQALEGNDLASTLARAERGIACGATGEVRGTLRLLQAEAHRWRGEHGDAARAAADALEGLPRGAPRWFSAAGELAVASGRTGDTARMLEIAHRIREQPAGMQVGGPHLVSLVRAAVPFIYGGEFGRADEILALVEDSAAAASVNDPSATASLHSARAFRALLVEDLALHREEMVAAAAAFEAGGHLRNASEHRLGVGFASMELGQYADAETALRSAVALGEKLGLRHIVVAAQHNLGLALARLGKFDEAIALESGSVKAFAAQNNSRSEGVARNYLAMILGMKGDLDAAETEARNALAILTAPSPARALVLGTLARTLAARGRGQEALPVAREATALVDSVGRMFEGESLVRLALAEACDVAGDVTHVPNALARARSRLLERADKIQDAVLRAGFLDRVPENARTIAWADSLLGHSGP